MPYLTSKKMIPYRGKVHDLTVSNSCSYNIEGKVVHNSACGSLLLWVIGVTRIDSIRFGLISERILVKSKSGASDVDMDNADRGRAVRTLKRVFGEDNVIRISSFGQFQLKSLIKDLAKLNNIPYEEINVLTKNIDIEVLAEKKKIPGFDRGVYVMTHEDAKEFSPSFQQIIKTWPELDGPIKVLFKQIKSLGSHAGGILLTENAIGNLPLIVGGKGEDRGLQTPWTDGVNNRHLEEFGFLKFDLLGLETLAQFERVTKKILQRHYGVKEPSFFEIKTWFDERLDPDVQAFDDMRVYKEVYWNKKFCNVFQFINPGAQNFVSQIQPESITDIAAATSIFRPATLAAGVDKLYLKNKNNPNEIEFLHPLMEEPLRETKGCIIFQETLQMLFHVLAGIPLDETDKVRKAFTKKEISNKEKAAKDRQDLGKKFVEDCKKANNIPEETSAKIFDYLLNYASYGFNKCLLDETLIPIYSKEGTFVADKKIREICAGEYVQSRDELTKENIFIEVVAKHDHGILDLFEIEFGSGEKVVCTKDHKFRVSDGRMLPVWMILEGDLDIATNHLSEYKKIVTTKYFGNHQTYDLEVDHPSHQFYLSNGILTSNSHAVAYAATSWCCAWFLTYYETEWVSVYLDSCMDSKPEEKAAAVLEIKRLNYSLAKPDINHSDTGWAINDSTLNSYGKPLLVASFSAIKGIGEAAIEEIKANRPFNNVYDLFLTPDNKWRHSKFNRRALENLIKVGAFESMNIVGPGLLFENYKQMHTVLIGHFDELKKSTTLKKPPKPVRELMDEVVARVKATDPSDWTLKEKIDAMEELMGNVDIEAIVPLPLQEKFKAKGVQSIDSCDKDGVYWAVVKGVEVAKTKNGDSYLKLRVMGDSNMEKMMFVWQVSDVKNLDLPIFSVIMCPVNVSSWNDRMTFSTKAGKIRKIKSD